MTISQNEVQQLKGDYVNALQRWVERLKSKEARQVTVDECENIGMALVGLSMLLERETVIDKRLTYPMADTLCEFNALVDLCEAQSIKTLSLDEEQGEGITRLVNSHAKLEAFLTVIAPSKPEFRTVREEATWIFENEKTATEQAELLCNYQNPIDWPKGCKSAKEAAINSIKRSLENRKQQARKKQKGRT